MFYYTISLTAEAPFKGVFETKAETEAQAVRNVCYRIGEQYSIPVQTTTLRIHIILKNKNYKVLDRRSAGVQPSSGFDNTPLKITPDEILRDQLLEQAKKPFDTFTEDPDAVDDGTYSERDE